MLGVNVMNTIAMSLTMTLLLIATGAGVLAYPPAVGILGKSENCLKCHANNGNWIDGDDLVIDIVDKDTKSSLKQQDGSFLLSVKRGHPVTVLTIIGFRTDDTTLIPYRNGWVYIDTSRIKSSTLSKFSPGWEVNLPMACRLVGDKLDAYRDVHGTVLPMTVRPTDAAGDAEVTLQVMLTKGDTVKGKAKQGMVGSYFERTLRLKVEEQ
jgi:hypothetical protein